jgi:hypothetical protein
MNKDLPEINAKSDFNYEVWYDSIDPSFIEISKGSRLPDKWLNYQHVLSGKYMHSVIKPINRYVENLYIKPKLISFDDEKIVLQQGNHAEMLVQQKEEEFYNVDRPWMRQYYKSKESNFLPEGCFPGTYKFYIPWIIDENVSISIEQPENSPFYIYPVSFESKRIDPRTQYIEPPFVNFHFKNTGSHMIKDGFGKILRQSPMFNMVIRPSGIIVERVRKFYEQD